MDVAKQHRLAITGASSTGKTTQAETLMRDRKFSRIVDTLIPERARPLLGSHTSFDGMTRDELRDFQRQLFMLKQKDESIAVSYLADRSFVDMLRYGSNATLLTNHRKTE